MKKPRKKRKSIKAVVKKGHLEISMRGKSLTDLIPEELPERKPTPAQKKNQGRFWEATQYATAQMKKPQSKAEYKTAGKKNTHHVAFLDYLRPPKVLYVDARKYLGTTGDVILVKATDDFKVVSVSVTIFIGQKVLESGNATPYFRKRDLWQYFATMPNTAVSKTAIRAVVKDKPGNKAEMKAEAGEKVER